MTTREKAFVLNGARLWLRSNVAGGDEGKRQVDLFVMCQARRDNISRALLEETRQETHALLEQMYGMGELREIRWPE